MNKSYKQTQEENVEKKEINCTCGCDGQSKNSNLLIRVKNTQHNKKEEDCC